MLEMSENELRIKMNIFRLNSLKTELYTAKMIMESIERKINCCIVKDAFLSELVKTEVRFEINQFSSY